MNHFKNQVLHREVKLPILYDLMLSESAIADSIIVYVHGFNGFKDWANFDLIASQFVDAGFDFLKFNFSQNGTSIEHPEQFVDLESYGNNNYTIELDDLNDVIKFISENEATKNKKIILLGHSRGGGISILKASEDARVDALITWASISECKTPWATWSESKLQEWKEKGVQYYSNKRTNQEMPLYYQLYLDFQNNQDRLNIQKAITSLRIPILLIHGTNDEAVPFEKATELHQWQPNAKLVSLPSDHVFGRKHPWVLNEVPEFTQRAISESITFLKENK